MRKFSILSTLFLATICLSSTVSATSIKETVISMEDKAIMQENSQNYQYILDKLNLEYGTNVYFSSEDEIKRVGDTVSKITYTPDEFEEYVRGLIEDNLAANARAKDMATKVRSKIAEEHERDIFANETHEYQVLNEQEPAGERYFNSKDVDNGKISLGAYVGNELGYWRFKSIYRCDLISHPLIYIETGFEVSNQDYTYLDMQRSCFVEFWGRTYSRITDITIDGNAYRCAEFWAGDNEYSGV